MPTSTSACCASARRCRGCAGIDAQLRLPGLGRDKVVALAVALLDATLIRVGNHRYARDNRSYGLTTLRTRHVDVNGSRIRFRFKGKSGIEHDVSLEHPRLARVLRRCLELPGQDLLQYLDEDGQPHRIGSHDINEYLRRHTGEDFSAKDYRTWAGSALALERLRRAEADGLGAVVAEVAAEWATAWRSAGNATSTRRSSRPTRPGNWASSGAPASAAG